MGPKRFLEDREHALENEYFHRKDRELIERLREEGRKQAERHDLETPFRNPRHGVPRAAASRRVLRRTILHCSILVPLVEVAWSEGEVTSRERELILALARHVGALTT